MGLKLENYIKHLFYYCHLLFGGVENLSPIRQHLFKAQMHTLGHSEHIDTDVAGEIGSTVLDREDISPIDLFKYPAGLKKNEAPPHRFTRHAQGQIDTLGIDRLMNNLGGVKIFGRYGPVIDPIIDRLPRTEMGDAGQDLQVSPINLELVGTKGDQTDKFTEKKGRQISGGQTVGV